MPKPTEIELGRPEPPEREPEGTRLGFVHPQPLGAVLERNARHVAIRMITLFVHASTRKGYGRRSPHIHPPMSRGSTCLITYDRDAEEER
jgi:hypothetical protein